MADNGRNLRIGELLMHFGLLTQDDLSRAVDVAGRMGVPIGRALISLELTTEEKLQAALRAQSLLREGLLELDLAQRAMKLVIDDGLEIDSALEQLGFEKDSLESGPTSELGDLLLAAGLVTREQLNVGLIMRFETSMPLGRVLVLTGMLSDALVATSINAQMMIREGKISRHDAVEALKAALARKKVAETTQDRAPRLPAHYWVRLGKLFVLAGILSEVDIARAVEVSLLEQETIGPVMVKLGLITNQLLDVALKLQGMVARGTLTPIQSAKALREIFTDGVSLDQIVGELVLEQAEDSHQAVQMVQLFKLANILTDSEIERSIKQASENSTLMGRMLVAAGAIDESMLNAGLRCELLQSEGYLSTEQAVFLLPYCQKRGLSLDEGMEQLGWTSPAHLDWQPVAPAVAKPESSAEAEPERSAKERPAKANAAKAKDGSAVSQKASKAKKTPESKKTPAKSPQSDLGESKNSSARKSSGTAKGKKKAT
jgi:hypothetical protein